MAEMRFEDRMSDADALMWTIEKDPLLRSTITAVAVFDRPPTATGSSRPSTAPPGSSPGCASGCVANPLSIAPPRWEVDPNFDLAFHLRWLRAGRRRHRCATSSTSPSPSPCRASTGPGRCGSSRSSRASRTAGPASILKLHHAITDGVGGVKLAMHLFDLDRDGTDQGAMPDGAAGARPEPARAGRSTRSTTSAAASSASPAARLAHGRRRGRRRRRPTPAAPPAALGATPLASVGRMLAPATEPLSDVMTGRSLSVRFDALRAARWPT